MASRPARLVAVIAAVALGVAACSSSHPSAGSASTPPSSSDRAAVQTYLDAVNHLCDALLTKVTAVTHGGSLDVPVQQYLAQQPAHAQLLADFDRQLAQVPVPSSARDKSAALAAYIRFANQLDAKRLAAAHRGAAAYAQEIAAESSIESDPTIQARNAAGFAQSCDAR